MMVSSFIGVLYSTLDCHFFTTAPFRIVPGFLVQTGDKTGTGAGGESFYGGSYIFFSCQVHTPNLFQLFRTIRR